ncbi:MAG: hypothetical protein AB7O73_07145, partial [Bacteroidia bacterium]
GSFLGEAQTKGKSTVKSKTTKTVKGKKGKNVEDEPTDRLAGEEEEEYDPWKEFEYTLEPETEIDSDTGKEKFYPERKKKNDSLRAVFRVQLKKERNSFRVYSRHPHPKSKKKEKIKLCVNITAKDTNFTYMITDTMCKDPEVYKLLYKKEIKDTVYWLIYIDAFAKTPYKGGICHGKHETKVYFVKWVFKDNKVIPYTKPKFKATKIASCISTITNMTTEDPLKWDGKSTIKFSYNKGSHFYDVEFDPNNPHRGLEKSKL